MIQSLPFFFFFNDTATTEIYTLSLHDALPISAVVAVALVAHVARQAHVAAAPVQAHAQGGERAVFAIHARAAVAAHGVQADAGALVRSEEHTSELQSRLHLVCRLLLEKKK